MNANTHAHSGHAHPPADTPVIIIGAGLAGLCAARSLARAGVPFLVLEASDAVGGRVRTDRVDGFLLDRGFQVYLTAYEEAAAVLDHQALDLRPFEPGAAVFFDGRFHTLLDPWRRPAALLDGALARVGTFADKLRVGALRAELARKSRPDLFADDAPETSTLTALRDRGFSEAIIERFFRPFFGGIFLDPSLQASSRMMEFVFRAFAQGRAAIPRLGLQRIPEQLAAALPPGSIRFRAPVEAVEPGASPRVRLRDGQTLPARAVIFACPARALDVPDAPALEPVPPQVWQGVAMLAFDAPSPPPRPLDRPILVLDGENTGPVTNLVALSSVSDAYAPATTTAPAPGARRALIVATALVNVPDDDRLLERDARAQLSRWFGPAARVADWRLLRLTRIREGLPRQHPPWYNQAEWSVRYAPGCYRAGDLNDTASIDGAMRSGRRAAEALIEDLASLPA